MRDFNDLQFFAAVEDLTDSHVIATTWPLPPTLDQCRTIARARARFHALWWDDPRLGTAVGAWTDADPWTGICNACRTRWRVSPIALATARRVSGATSTTGCSPRHPACSSAINPIATSRSSRGTHTSGI